MDISDMDVKLINDILEKKESATGHFLELCPQDPMIYGADGPQRIYLDLLLIARGGPQSNDLSTMPKADHPFISNYYLDWNVQGEVTKSGLERSKSGLGPKGSSHRAREIQRRDFARRAQGSKMALPSVEKDALQTSPAYTSKLIQGIKKDNPALNPTLATIARGDFDDQIKNFGVRRACKFLIYDAIERKRKIAYVLDDLNLTEVVKKHARYLDPDSSNRRKVPVCTSEIREIFRRWDRLQEHVVFFRWFRKAPAPWDCDYYDRRAYENWAGYAKERATKLAARMPNGVRKQQLQAVVEKHDDGDYTGAIDAFFACKPSTLTPPPSAAWDA